MAYENSAGLGVSNQYNARNTGGAVGVEHSTNSIQTLTYDLTGEMLNSPFVPPVVVPKGAKVIKVLLVVDQVFDVSAGGTVAVGGTAPATNGVVLTEAQLEGLGSKDITGSAVGTWSAGSTTGTLTAQRVAKAITGTVNANVGRASLVVEYFNKAVG